MLGYLRVPQEQKQDEVYSLKVSLNYLYQMSFKHFMRPKTIMISAWQNGYMIKLL